MKICYFGIYKSDFSRNRVYLKGFRELGVEIVECQDDSRGLIRKYWNLWRKHRKIGGDYDAMIVGYPGHMVVPLARIISKKLIIADLLGSLYDAEVHSHMPGILKRVKSMVIDWMAVLFANKILLESEAQKKYFEQRFGHSEKYKVVYTGVDEGVYSQDSESTGVPTTPHGFTVLFRGKLTPECGIGYILDAAEILKNEKDITFKIIGRGYLLSKVERIIEEKGLKNVELDSRYLSDDEMREVIRGASVYLGQFEDNHRLKRTIPHKAFEAFVAGIPYLTEDAEGIRELVIDGETGFLVPMADPKMIAKKIMELSKNPDLLKRVSVNAKKMYEDKLTPMKLAGEIVYSL